MSGFCGSMSEFGHSMSGFYHAMSEFHFPNYILLKKGVPKILANSKSQMEGTKNETNPY